MFYTAFWSFPFEGLAPVLYSWAMSCPLREKAANASFSLTSGQSIHSLRRNLIPSLQCAGQRKTRGYFARKKISWAPHAWRFHYRSFWLISQHMLGIAISLGIASSLTISVLKRSIVQNIKPFRNLLQVLKNCLNSFLRWSWLNVRFVSRPARSVRDVWHSAVFQRFIMVSPYHPRRAVSK